MFHSAENGLKVLEARLNNLVPPWTSGIRRLSFLPKTHTYEKAITLPAKLSGPVSKLSPKLVRKMFGGDESGVPADDLHDKRTTGVFLGARIIHE